MKIPDVLHKDKQVRGLIFIVVPAMISVVDFKRQEKGKARALSANKGASRMVTGDVSTADHPATS